MKKNITIAILAACAAAFPLQGGDVKIKIDPPVYIVFGTPAPIKIDNFDPIKATKPAEFLVPEGTTNIAKNKPVTSSDKSPIVGELSFVTDGDKDGDEGFEVELAPGFQWVQIDLSAKSDIYAINVWHYHRQDRAYRHVIVQISDDAEFKTGVTTVFNTDIANENKLGVGKDKHYIETNYGKFIPVKDVSGRYVRLYSAGNTSNPGNHYVEVEVFGKPVK
ncbi:MAG: discoidin domain-containing protein [Puniceicoccales bacterium]|nr:discoidin domain-containing protein [Puniceicoccales bacterium]